MLADNLLGAIAFNRLRAGVPVGDPPVLVEHVDRIVAHALDEHTETLLALEQHLLLGSLVGDIARDLGEAEELALLVADWIDDGICPETRPVLAYPPTLALEPAFAGGDAQRPGRHVQRYVFGFQVATRPSGSSM